MIRNTIFSLLLLVSAVCARPAFAASEPLINTDPTENTSLENYTDTQSSLDEEQNKSTELNNSTDEQSESPELTEDTPEVSEGFLSKIKNKCVLPTLSDSQKVWATRTAGVGIAALISYTCYRLYTHLTKATDYDLLLAAEIAIDQTSQDLQKMKLDHRAALTLIDQNADPEAITQALHQTIYYEVSPKPFVAYVNQLNSSLNTIERYKTCLIAYKSALIRTSASLKEKESNENNTNLIKEFNNTINTIKPLVEQLHNFAQKLYTIQTYATRTPEYVQEHILERIESLEKKFLITN